MDVLRVDLSVSELAYLYDEAGFDIFEPYLIDDADAIETAMEETGVEMPTAHAGGLQDDVEGTVETFEWSGAGALVLPSGGDWNGEEAIVEWAEMVSELASEIEEHSDGR